MKAFPVIRGFLLILVLQTFTYGLQAQTGLPAGAPNGTDNGISVRGWVDRTALFPGDRVRFHVEIICNRNVDILAADLGEDELVLTGLELISSRLEQSVSDGGSSYYQTYELTTYETGRVDLKIDELRIRYYLKRPGQRIEDVATAGEVIVPGTSLVLRSTLPAELSSLGLRDQVSGNVLSTWLGISGALGFCLLLVSGVPAGFIIFRYVRKDGMDKHQQMEKVIQVSSSELDRIRHFDPVDALQRREGFDRLDTILKEYIKNVTGISAECLTAKELFTFLKDAGLEISVQDLTAVLEDCERARYDKPENLPGIAQYNNGISVAQGILTPQ